MTGSFKKLTSISSTEWPFTLLMGLQFFLIIGVFWILKPLKKALFIQLYDATSLQLFHFTFNAAQAELLAKNLNMLAAFAVMLLFLLLSKRFKRHVLVAATTAICISTAVGVWMWLKSGEPAAIWAFYVFGDLFNTLMLAAFFAFLNDSVTRSQSKRLFGTIIFGGVLGGAIGSTLMRSLIDHLSLTHWFGICVAVTAIVAALAWTASKHPLPLENKSRPPMDTQSPALLTSKLRRQVFTPLLRSKYILSIVAIVASYEVVSSIIDFQFSQAVSHYLNGAAIGRYFSSVYMTMNIVSLSIQLFATGLVMRRLGVTHALLFLPISLLMGSLTFLALPILLVSALLCIFDNGLNYSMNQSAKESLYVPVDSDSRYRAKAIVDIFTQRSAKAIGVNITLLLSAMLSFRWLALASICIIVVWIAAAAYAGRRFDRMDDNNFDDGPESWQKNETHTRLPKKIKLFPIIPLKF